MQSQTSLRKDVSNMRIFEIPSNSTQRVTYIPNLTYQNTAYWFDQTRRDWQMDLLLPFNYAHQTKHPLVLWLSGGSWQMMDRHAYLPELTFLARAGYIVASIDYHMGSEGAFPIQLRDVRQALAYLRTQQSVYSIDWQAVTLMGDSAGGQLALMAGYTMAEKTLLAVDLGPMTSIQQVVAYYAPTDLVALKGFYQNIPEPQRFDYQAPVNFLLHQMDADESSLRRASPVFYVQGKLPKTLLLQGDADDWVPLKQAQTLYEALRKQGQSVDLFQLKGGQHIDPRFFAPALDEAVLAFMQSDRGLF